MIAAALIALTLTERFADIAATSGGRMGVCVQEAADPRPQALNGDERFPMQSVYKLPIAMAVLDLVDRHVLTLAQKVPLRASDVAGVHFHSPLRERYPQGGVELTVRDLIRAAIVDSDGVASDLLYALAGGGRPVTAYVRGLGVSGLAVVTTEHEMAADELVQYRNYATPCAAVSLLRALDAGRGLSAGSRDLLLQDLTESGPGANRIKGQLPPGTPVAHKPGTDFTRNGLTRATNDIGIVTLPDGRHLTIAVFVRDSTAGEQARERAIAAAARAAYDAWVTR